MLLGNLLGSACEHARLPILLLVFSLPVTVAIAIVVIEAWAGYLLPRKRAAAEFAPGPIAVLIPAHDEVDGIETTIGALQNELRPGDRLLVVADNCTDRTAAVARAAGAEVRERFDPDRRGKGHALAFGIAALRATPPRTLIIIDADCTPSPGSLRALAAAAEGRDRPAQAIYLLDPPDDAGVRTRVSVLAFLFKNVVRPRGLQRLGLPCPLTGTGMAIPWRLVDRVTWASSNLVEDMQLGIDFTLAGHGPTLCEDALVISNPPSTVAAATTQRTRWEHGHLATLLRAGPRLIGTGIRRRKLGPLAAGIDLAVPPLASVCLAWIALAAIATPLWAIGAIGSSPKALLMISGLALLATIATAIVRDGGQRVRLRDLASVPIYVAWKMPLYARFLTRRETRWVRTDRNCAARSDAND